MQASFFFLLPSILLSGFMFPFRGMPPWAQWLGEVLPVTHFLRIVRGVMLKGATFGDIAAELAALGVILLVVSALAISRYRITLDGAAKPAALTAVAWALRSPGPDRSTFPPCNLALLGIVWVALIDIAVWGKTVREARREESGNDGSSGRQGGADHRRRLGPGRQRRRR